MSHPSHPDPTALADQLGKVVTSPQFQGIIQELASLPESEREARARELASPDTLRARGVPYLPEGLRLSTRVFERPSEGASATGDVEAHAAATGTEPDLTVCVSVGGLCVCASVG